MLKTLIVSDIHLGARNSRPDQLSALLQTDFDRLVLNGDTVDHLNFARFRWEDWAVLEQLRCVARERELILVRGNHDGDRHSAAREFGPLDVLAQLLETDLHEEYQFWVGRRCFLVLHGDQFDRSLNMTWVGHAADVFYQQVQRCSRPTARWLKMRVKHWCGVANSVRRGAVDYARQRGCHGVIVGHTHFHADEVIDGTRYLNSGCWVDSPCTYLEADDNDIQLVCWEPSMAMLVPALEQPILGVPPRRHVGNQVENLLAR